MSGGLYNPSSSSTSRASSPTTPSDWFAAIANPNTSITIPTFGVDVSQIVFHLHFFVLALCIINTVFLLVDFYVRYFKIAAQDDFLAYQKQGHKSFDQSTNTWTTYIPLLLIFACYTAALTNQFWSTIFAIVYIIACLIKILHEYKKTPIGKVLRGEDKSVVSRVIDAARTVTGLNKKSKQPNVNIETTIVKDVVNEVGAWGSAAAESFGVKVTKK